jgi:uncharacterized protein
VSVQWPTTMRRVFVDTSAYYALTDSRDVNHATAVEIARRLARDHRTLFTTNLILAEIHALLLARLGRGIAARFLDEIDGSSITVIRVGVRDEQRAREIITQYADKDFSLTDAVTFAVMERLHITQAFVFDHHFAQFGVAAVDP